MNEISIIETGKLVFIMSDTILVKTNLQQFYLSPTDNRKLRLNKIRVRIENGQIQSLENLASFCGSKVLWTSKT